MPKFVKYIRKSALVLLILSNIATVAWLILCKWASLKDVSATPSFISLMSFSVLGAIILNVFFFIFWIFTTHKWLFILSLITLASTYDIVLPVWGYHMFTSNEQNIADGSNGIKVMSWNVHLFDLGEWTFDKSSQAKILEFINTEAPDILCLQEYYQSSDNSTEPYTALIQQQGYPYMVFAKEYEMSARKLNISAAIGEKIETGVAIFSKMPITNSQIFSVGKGHAKLLSADISADSTFKFTVNTVHLQSFLLNDTDESNIDSITHQPTEVKQNKYKSLIKKLEVACAKRAAEANDIDSVNNMSLNPLIVMGDFNDVPSSYSYATIKGDLNDAFINKGFGLGRTCQKIAPTLRIDYIFYNAQFFECQSYLKPINKLSDHYPVTATFILKKNIKEPTTK